MNATTTPWPPDGPTSVQNVIPCYPYVTYQNDDAVTAFFEAYNIYAQAYLDYFNQLDLPIYTKGPVQGMLLDWVAQSIYGISRPALPTAFGTPPQGPVNTFLVNALTWNGYRPGVPDSFTSTSDDIFRRIITWAFYKGDGKTFNIRWLKRRINRFLNGINGTDVLNDTTFDISVAPTSFQVWSITLANTPASTVFKIAVEAGVLELPFQIQFNISLV